MLCFEYQASDLGNIVIMESSWIIPRRRLVGVGGATGISRKASGVPIFAWERYFKEAGIYHPLL